MIINDNLTNLEYMFKDAKSLENIEGLKNLNTKNVSNFSIKIVLRKFSSSFSTIF